MENERLVFGCSCGGLVEDKAKVKLNFFGAGYDTCVEWTDFDEDVPDLDERIWHTSYNIPKIGEVRTTRVRMPFNEVVGDEFFVLYRPVNDWRKAEEIDSSAIVKCRFEKILTKNDNGAWVKVKVIEVLRLNEIYDKIPVIKGEPDMSLFDSAIRESYIETFGDWIRITWSAQCDWEEWVLIRRDVDGSDRAIIYGEWDFHMDFFSFGNLVLPDDFVEKWNTKIKAASMIGKKVTVTVDRPLGTYHPKHPDIYYPINYGYIEGIMAPDGEEQDAYILGVDEPVKEFTGIVIAIIYRNDDVEQKWVVAPERAWFTADEVRQQVHFQEQYFDTQILI